MLSTDKQSFSRTIVVHRQRGRVRCPQKLQDPRINMVDDHRSGKNGGFEEQINDLHQGKGKW
jgi:hypothetical protein